MNAWALLEEFDGLERNPPDRGGLTTGAHQPDSGFARSSPSEVYELGQDFAAVLSRRSMAPSKPCKKDFSL